MPKPVFADDDFVNPDAPKGERRLKPDTGKCVTSLTTSAARASSLTS
ncbi:hypothetical protein [Alloactinosynnema sp. L-07]|nr:hypothetical protein [Alloactinosynnema sp. L-07]